MRPLRISGVGASVLIVIAVLVIVLAWHYSAKGETVEEWVHRTNPQCCPHDGCVAVHAWRTTGGVWMVHWRGVETPYLGRVQPSPAETIACGNDQRIWCLFIQGGTS